MTKFNDTFWDMLDPTDQAALRQSGVVKHYAYDEILCSQGERMRHIIVVLSGQVEIKKHSKDGRQVVIAFCGPGDIIGELASVDRRPRSADARAINEVDAIVVSAKQFDRLLQNHSKITWAVLRVISGRLREANQRRLDHVIGAASVRIACVLLDIARQRGVTTNQGTKITSINQEIIGTMSGVSRTSVTRALRDLRLHGLVITSRENITIPRIDLLQQWANSAK